MSTTNTPSTTPTAFLGGNTPKVLTGWFVVFMILLIASESSPTLEPLAVAFAWLIAVSVIYAAGPELWTGLNPRIATGSITGAALNAAGTSGPPPTGH
jgi:disulfide bond formation protein DsbB